MIRGGIVGAVAVACLLGGCVERTVVSWPDPGAGGIESPCQGAATIAVPDECPMIQWAIDAAWEGGVVEVAPGSYFERLDFHGKDVRVLGAGSAETTLDGTHDGSVVQFVSGEGPGATLQGFTVTHGSALLGGGVLVDGSSPTLLDLVIRRCTASAGGGVCLRDAAPLLAEIVVEGNEAAQGGGVYVTASAPVLQDVAIHGNVATSLADEHGGGGLFVERGSAVTVARGSIRDNLAPIRGGGATVRDSRIALLGAEIADNVVDPGPDARGAGLDLDGAEALLENVVVAGNILQVQELARGAGIHARESSLVATNLVVVDNHKAEDAWNTAGGGLSVEGGTVRVAHAVLAGNQSSGLWAVDAAVELKHTLVAWNQWYGVRLEGDATVTARYCDLWGHQGGDWSGGDGPGDGGGNLAVDPQVLAFELGEDPWVWEVLGFDLHLAVDSPLVDAGDPAISDPDGSPADIGPYGGPGAGGYDADLDGYPRWWQPGPYEPGSYPALGWDCDDANDGVHPGSGC